MFALSLRAKHRCNQNTGVSNFDQPFRAKVLTLRHGGAHALVHPIETRKKNGSLH
jgi:hypothetical protein